MSPSRCKESLTSFRLQCHEPTMWVNAANEFMNSLVFFIQGDHRDASAERHS